jgi:hypothetical protein
LLIGYTHDTGLLFLKPNIGSDPAENKLRCLKAAEEGVGDTFPHTPLEDIVNQGIKEMPDGNF